MIPYIVTTEQLRIAAMFWGGDPTKLTYEQVQYALDWWFYHWGSDEG